MPPFLIFVTKTSIFTHQHIMEMRFSGFLAFSSEVMQVLGADSLGELMNALLMLYRKKKSYISQTSTDSLMQRTSQTVTLFQLLESFDL